MQLTTSPLALPASCMLCPGSVRKLYVDTGVQIEWFGAIILCDECIKHMGRMIGMITEADRDTLVTTLAEKEDRLYELQKQLAALEGVKNALVAGGWMAPDDPRGMVVSHADDEGPRGESPTDDRGLEVGVEDQGGGLASQGGAPPESLHDEVMARLRPNAASGFLKL